MAKNTPTVSEIVDELAKEQPPKRIWEVDFVRGLMILFVVWDHFMYDVSAFEPYQSGLFNWLYALSARYYSGVLRQVAQPVFVTMFVFTSGVACSFSRSNGKRALRMMAFALLFTAATRAAEAIVRADVTIYFNVIHVIALSVALYTAVEWVWKKCVKGWQKNLFGIVMTAVTLAVIIVGACANAKPWTNDNPLWFFLAMHNSQKVPAFTDFYGGDYLPFFPAFGWFLVGAFLGKFLYRQRQSLFPTVNEKWVCPVTFCGRHAIWIYFGSQLFMYGLFYLFCVLI